MRELLLIGSVLLAASTAAQQSANSRIIPPPDYPIDEPIGPHHKRVEVLRTEIDASGQPRQVPSSYVHVEPGLNYLENGDWIESQAVLQASTNSIVGLHTQHRVEFSADISDPWSVDLETPDGRRLRSRVLGLSLYDAESGKSVLIGEIVSTRAKIVNGNEVWFQDCFDGIRADVQYVYAKGSIEQNIVLREAPPDPVAYGLNPDTVRLEVLTEFDGLAQPTKKEARFVRREHDLKRRKEMAEPDLVDNELIFGAMRMVRGRAFGLSEKTRQDSVPVVKRWMEMEQRQFLIEQVELPSIASALKDLPTFKDRQAPPRRQASVNRHFPQRHIAKVARDVRKPIEIAQAESIAGPGYVIDYGILTDINGTVSFAPITYYVAGPATITGNATFPQNMVLKYAAGASVTVLGSTFHSANSGSPLVFTAKDDNTIGETISGSTGNPSGYYASFCLWAQAISPYAPSQVQYFDIRYASIGLKFSHSSWNWSVHNCDFSDSATAVYIDGINLPVQDSEFCNVTTWFQTVNGGSVTESGNTSCSSGNQAPYFINPPISKPDAASGSLYNNSIGGDAIDPDGDSLTFSKLTGPSWLTVASIGNLTGTPGTGDLGWNYWTVRVQDPYATYSDTTLSIYVQFGGTSSALGEAVDNTLLTWTTGGYSNWYSQSGISTSGGDAAQSGSITHYQSTYLQTTVTGPGLLSFWWQVSSEYWYDYLRFYIDGSEQTKISGEVGWHSLSYPISSGSHTLQWSYTKDVSVHRGSDAGWVDAVAFTADTDSDGLPDTWELQYFGDLNQTADGDFDGDGLTNLQEYQGGTDPTEAPSCYPVPSGLVSWWSAEGTADDENGLNPGFPYYGASYAAGKVGQAFILDGINDVINVPSSASLNFNSNSPITVETWVYRTGSASIMHVLGKRNGCWGFNYQLAFDPSGGLQFNSSYGGVYSGVQLQMFQWTHLAATYESGVFRMYINGALTATGSGALGPTNTTSLSIGGSGTCGYTFGGLIDEVSLYDRALSAAEIQSIYATGALGKCPPDTDADGLSDGWELQYFGNLNENGGGDFEKDGVTNADEQSSGTDPTIFNAIVKIARPRNGTNIP